MEETKYGKREHNAIDFKAQNLVPGIEQSTTLPCGPVQTLGIVGREHLDAKIASLTPEKTNEPLHNRHKEEAAELPEKYRIIAEYFYRMTCSLRLLALSKQCPTFQNISRQVEILTGRKFSYRHLAQIKYMLPEAVKTDNVLIHDLKSLCMKPDIKVTLLLDVVEGHQKQSTFMALHQVFTSRLFSFSTKHPKGCEIPEAEMPESQQDISETNLLNSSHLYPAFNRHFSKKVVAEKEKKSKLLASPIPISSAKYECASDKHMGSEELKVSSDECSKYTPISNPVQLAYPACCVSSTASESTPLKAASEGSNLMVETPAQLTLKRSLPGDNKLKTLTIQKWTADNMSAKRSLDFSLMKDDESALNSPTDEIDWSKVSHDTIPQAITTMGVLVQDSCASSAEHLQKVEESCTGQKTNRTGLTVHQEMSACLSDLIALIHQIFHSVGCSSITKEELIHKIIINSYDIVERREVEDQIELLEKQVPEWICRKLGPSGDILYNIKKVSDMNSIHKRLLS